MEHRFLVTLNGKKKYGYGMHHAGFPLFDSLWVKNETEYAFSDLSVRVVTEPKVLLQGDLVIDYLPEKGYKAFSCDFIRLDLSLIASVRSVTPVTVSVEFQTAEGKLVDIHEFSFQLLPYDCIPGWDVMPECLAMFVTPDQKEVKRIADSLKELTLPDFCRESYDFIKLRKITFSPDEPPSSKPAKLRLAESIFSENRAGALELCLLYASLAECAGFAAVLYLTGKGKTYVRITDGKKRRPVVSYCFAEEIDLVDGVILDGSYFGYGSELDFESALQQSKKSLSFFDGKICVIDIACARRMHVRPLPNRVEEHGSFVLSDDSDAQGEAFSDYMELLKKYAGNERVLALLTANKIPVKTKKEKFSFKESLDVNQNKILQKLLRDDFTLVRAQHGTGMTTLFAEAAALYMKAGRRVLYLCDPRDGSDSFVSVSARYFDPAFTLDLTKENVPPVDLSFKGLFSDHDGVFDKSSEVTKAFRDIDHYYETVEGGKRIVTTFLLAAERFIQLRSIQEGIVFSPEQIGQLSDEVVKMWFSTVSELDQTLSETGPVNEHPLRLIRQPVFSYEYKSKLIGALESVVSDLADLLNARESVRADISDLPGLTSRSQMESFVELIRLLSGSTPLAVSFFDDPDRIDDQFRLIAELIRAKKENDAIANIVFLSFEDSILELDAADLLDQWSNGAGEKGFRALSKRHGIVKSVKRYLKPNFDVENVELILTKLASFQANEAFFEKERSGMFARLGIEGDDDEAWDRFSRANDLCYQVYNVYLSAFRKEQIGAALSELKCALEQNDAPYAALRNAYQSFRKNKAALEETVCQSLDAFYSELNGEDADYWASLRDKLSVLLTQMDGLRAWCDWLSVSGRACEIGLKNVVSSMESGRVPVEHLKKAFLRAFFKGVCEYNFMISPEIAPGQFDFDEKYRIISDSSDALYQEKRAELNAMLSVNKLDAQGELSEAKDPAEILVTDKDRFASLYPCVISDLSTAEDMFGDLEEFFDLILIENRRSFPLRDMLWVFQTGINVVFAGDFSLKFKNDDHVFDVSAPAFDTLWNATDVHCSASCVYGRSPAMTTLLANALSAFRHDARCYGVPQPKAEKCSEWVEVNGFYNTEYNGANLQEARYIVDRLIRFCMDPTKKRLSVICATPQQKDLILHLFSQKLRHQSDLAELLTGPDKQLIITSVNEDLPFSDSVIFSCTYAPDRSVPGIKLPADYFKFASPDAKRTVLDVLSSAAKDITVVASFGKSDLDHVETLFPVTDAFSVMYELCSVGTVNNGYHVAGDVFPTNSILALERILREKGYQTVLNVQNGRFFLDLAVLTEKGFVLGVISDQTVLNQKSGIGAIEYANRKLFLENGWRIYRLHSNDAVDSLEREAERVIALLEQKEMADPELV